MRAILNSSSEYSSSKNSSLASSKEKCSDDLKKSESSSEKSDIKKDPIYRAIIIFWSFVPAYVIFTDTRPIWLILMVMACIVLVIPILAISLLKITNDKNLMGRYANNWITNGILVMLTLIAYVSAYLNGDKIWNNIWG